MSVCWSVRMSTVISDIIKATILGLGMQILLIPAQRKFVSQRATPTLTPTSRLNLWLLQF